MLSGSDNGAGIEFIYGDDGDDVARGGDGPDRIQLGAGNDKGYGGKGRDKIRANDGSPDNVVCGPGLDRAVVDELDSVARDCELIFKAAPATMASTT